MARGGNGSCVFDSLKRCTLGAYRDRACVGVGVDRTFDIEVLDGPFDLFEHRDRNGHGLAVAVKCTGELTGVGGIDGDVCRKIVLAVSRHVLEIFGAVDGGSLGGECAYREEGEDHDDAEDQRKCFAHDVYLFHYFFGQPRLPDRV